MICLFLLICVDKNLDSSILVLDLKGGMIDNKSFRLFNAPMISC